MPDTIFIDTNVLLSGLIFKGNESRVLDMCARGDVRLMLAQTVIDESRKVLAAKFPAHVRVLDDFLAVVQHDLVDYPKAETVELAVKLVRDPSDAPILASIIEANPDVALSGDRDLLTDELATRYRICNCADYLRRHKG